MGPDTATMAELTPLRGIVCVCLCVCVCVFFFDMNIEIGFFFFFFFFFEALLMEGNFFLGVALATTLTKMSIRIDDLPFDVVKKNMMKAEVFSFLNFSKTFYSYISGDKVIFSLSM